MGKHIHNISLQMLLVALFFIYANVPVVAQALSTQSQENTTEQTSVQPQGISAASVQLVNSQSLSPTAGKDVQSFSPDPQLAMSSEIYRVTAGDIYELAFAAGTTPITYTIPVDTTYKIRVANLAVLDAKGMTFRELKNQVETIVSRNYPMSGVQFTLITPGVFTVTLAGEVDETIEKNAWALTRLSSVIGSSLTPYSSRRNITVTSVDGKTKTYDLFLAERKGDFSQDPYMRPGDTVTIHRFTRKVTIQGAVERPGEYELLKGENLTALIHRYGNGLAPLADMSRIRVYRITGEKDSGLEYYLKNFTMDSDYPLLCYDTITIESFKDLQSAMFIEGAVAAGQIATNLESSTKLTVTFNRGENYASLVRRMKSVFSASSDTTHAYIIRGNRKISMNLDKILYDASFYSQETVEPNDTLLIPFRQFFVTVSGAVNDPGRFPYIPDRDWTYYVGLAGGIDTYRNSFEATDIVTLEGEKLSKTTIIPPETTITVKENSLWYKWNKVSGGLTAILSAVSTLLSILVVTKVIH